MLTLTARITPLSAFGTSPKGDTLFGQLCWALRNRLGEDQLTKLLDGYTAGRPFAVVSDALPAGHLPRPALPGHWFNPLPGDDRKAAKKRVWLQVEHFAAPVADWLSHCRAASELPGGAAQSHPHPHNAIDRRTGTTGDGFAPYSMGRQWYGTRGKQATTDTFALIDATLDIYIALDESRLPAADLERALRDIGELGFGRDAGIGLGRFRVDAFDAAVLPTQADANAWLTLAPCAPQGLAWDAEHCFYTVFTRFGRHGDIGVHLGNPFKSPVLLANTGAALSPVQYRGALFTGQGLGGIGADGEGVLSKAIPETVHQGYAPVVGIRLPTQGGNKQ
ncbi:MAG: CRISPR-associated protein Csm7 [Pseudomonadota bacterium]|nr:CRISPR-associated protein Csm7 [Pseudomonadota bacterium]MDP1906633.1 CRISPR-associated protein Csm7 [Pseudomonadota bacterium]MDP2354052.1 CRISPR-associated protein Csm7 [Pseudomonadota bacterium]